MFLGRRSSAQAGPKIVRQQAKDTGIAGIIHPGAGPRDEKGSIVGRQGVQPGRAAPDKGGQRQQLGAGEAIVEVAPERVEDGRDDDGQAGDGAHLGLVDAKADGAERRGQEGGVHGPLEGLVEEALVHELLQHLEQASVQEFAAHRVGHQHDRGIGRGGLQAGLDPRGDHAPGICEFGIAFEVAFTGPSTESLKSENSMSRTRSEIWIHDIYCSPLPSFPPSPIRKGLSILANAELILLLQ